MPPWAPGARPLRVYPPRDASTTSRDRRSIAVVGAGYVGLVSAVGLASLGHAVELVETDPDRLAALREGRVPFSEPGVQEALTAALASGDLTILDGVRHGRRDRPHLRRHADRRRGHADVRAVEAVLAELASASPADHGRPQHDDGRHLSATPAGRRGSRPVPPLRVPEFLRQGSALEDFFAPSRVVIGRSPSADPDAEAVLTDLFAVFGAPLRLVTLEEAELIKNGANAFLALKISFANEIAALAERAGGDVGPVLDGIGLDPRVGPTYLQPSFGFGGSCLPKDLQTIASPGASVASPCT